MKPYEQQFCNIEISSFNKNNFVEHIKYFKNHYSRFNIIINLDNYNDFDELKNIIDNVINSGLSSSLCNFMVNVRHKIFTKKEYQNLIKLNDYMDQKFLVLFFKELNVLWFDNEFNVSFSAFMFEFIEVILVS